MSRLSEQRRPLQAGRNATSAFWSWVSDSAPGLALVVGVAIVARVTAGFLPSTISEITVGVLLGLAVANIVPLPAVTTPGIKFAVARLLRFGIVLLGARLSFHDVVAIGAESLFIVLAGMAVVLSFTLGVGRLVHLPPRLCLLIGVGTAVCGNSAIAATAPAVDARERDVSFAVATITLFGTLAVILYPLIGHAAALSDQFFGYWAGAAVNDTSQVVATGFAYSNAAGEVATVVKLTRNALMGPLIVIISLIYLRASTADAAETVQQATRASFLKAVPLFVLGFLAMATLNTFDVISPELSSQFNEGSKAFILAALVGVGLNTHLGEMRKAGFKPFYLGLAASLLLSVLAFTLIKLLVNP